MEDRDSLLRKLDGRAEIIWGDINDTIDSFTRDIDEKSPIGFISIDVDIYTATKAALRCLTGQPEKYNPAISMYFDDVSSFFSNEWAGELAAIEEFNQEREFRKISRDKSLPGRRHQLSSGWYPSMHVCHILDHQRRQRPRERQDLGINEHYDFMAAHFIF